MLAAGLTAPGGAAVGAAPPDLDRGGPGSWTKISTGGSGINFESSLHRTADGVLHVLYPRSSGADTGLAHTSISAGGAVTGQQDVLGTTWSIMDSAPVLVDGPGGGLRAVFGGQQTTSAGFWSDGRMYTATAPASGASWTLPAEAVGDSHSAYGSYGTAATTLADGTPVAAYPLNSSITWHVGTGAGGDQTFDVPCCAYDMTMVRDGENVWMAWYANGTGASANGTFVRQIYPTLGPIIKAPGSSVGGDSLPAGRVAMVARAGGGVYLAYCTGYPYCENVGLWKVGSSKVLKVPGTKYANLVALSAGPTGRLWLAWSDNIPVVKALRTDRSVGKLGTVRNVGMPHGKAAVYSLAIEGSTGRGDVVIQVGDGFWHTQVVAALTVRGKPGVWKHGTKKQKVAFTVTDAGDAVAGAVVKVGPKHCTTKASGKCVIAFPKSTKKGRLVVLASKPGYANAKSTLRVK
ncbi:hypothetical protein ACFP8W_09025 [Nocardioides hankookensis]|uniref:Carboxypeptidase regulatory-like domain-containing protein n=1 Tax=Nocardioides hankookensis TaxID=443157 RepID=A0ABW1LFF1_9ACTN